jgi:glutamine amidotransferase/cyclase
MSICANNLVLPVVITVLSTQRMGDVFPPLRNRSSSAVSSIEEIAHVYGNQAVVISIDPRRVYVKSPKEVKHRVIETNIPSPKGERYCWYQCTIEGGREGRALDALTMAQICEKLGAGEILLN